MRTVLIESRESFVQNAAFLQIISIGFHPQNLSALSLNVKKDLISFISSYTSESHLQVDIHQTNATLQPCASMKLEDHMIGKEALNEKPLLLDYGSSYGS